MPHGNSKIREEQLIEELNKGKKGKEIAEEWGLDPTTVSNKIHKLDGVELYSSTTANSTGAGILVTVSSKLLEEVGYNPSNTLYYSRAVGEGDILLSISEAEDNWNKMSSMNSNGDKVVSITGKQLQELGFESNEDVYVKKIPLPEEKRVCLKFSDKKAVKVES